MPTKRILCVDDDENTRELLAALLDFSHLEAVCVGDAGEALRMIERERFSLYILDGQLAGVSGLTLCERIRERDKDASIVIFSGHAYESDLDAGMSAGASAYVVKPDSMKLIATVKRLLEDSHVAAV